MTVRDSAIELLTDWEAPDSAQDALRLAVLFHHARGPLVTPRLKLVLRPRIRLTLAKAWLKSHPLTTWLLAQEREQWRRAGYPWAAMPLPSAAASRPVRKVK